ncbi:MAG: hypothetical protein E7592_03165 [Ruminococcaceae bacterium]|nr:hypothetical protein [Oscillospiraceae bacterium]
MQQEVYADLLFLINFSMDYLCLYICVRILRRKMRLGRMLLAASIGGIYSVVSLFLTASVPFSLLIDVGISLIMCAIVFSDKGRRFSSTLLCLFLFIGISMMTGGCMTAIFNLLNRLNLPLGDIEADGISTYLFAALAAIAGLISLGSGELISRRSAVKECLLTITIEGKTLTLRALADSGNLVKDALSGKAVILIDRAELCKITDLKQFDDFARGIEPTPLKIRGLRLIPINTASGRGMLVAAFADKLTAEITTKKNEQISIELDALISPSDIKNSAADCGAIIPSEILKP